MRRFGWFSTSPFTQPVVGSNPLALEGYKTLAYEIAEAMDWAVPDWCVLPVCYGDALAAIRRGFTDMVSLGWTNRVPRASLRLKSRAHWGRHSRVATTRRQTCA